MKLFGGKPKNKHEKNPDNQKTDKKSGLSKGKRRLLLLSVIFAAVLISAAAIKSIVKPPEAKPDPNPVNDDNGDETSDIDQGLELTVEDMGERKDDFFTMVVACTDEDKTRTDAMIVAAFDVKNQKINMVSVPRDTYSKVNRNLKKINSAYAVGKETQLIKELNMLLGIPIDRYAIFDFDGVAQMVKAIGGVEYEVPFRMKYDDPSQDLHIDLKAGTQKLDGEKAVQFLRWRENNPGVKGGYPDGDLGRIKAQQDFLMTLAKKMLVPTNILKVPEIAAALLNNTKTDFTKGELVWLGLAAVRLNSENISMQTLPGYSKTIYEPGVGLNQSYFFPDKGEILTLVNEKLNPYLESVKKITVVDVASLSSSSSKSSSTSTSKSSDKEQSDTSSKSEEPSKTGTSSGNAASQKPREQEPEQVTEPPAQEQPEEPVQPPPESEQDLGQGDTSSEAEASTPENDGGQGGEEEPFDDSLRGEAEE